MLGEKEAEKAGQPAGTSRLLRGTLSEAAAGCCSSVVADDDEEEAIGWASFWWWPVPVDRWIE